jgi:hypothetical protein
VWAVALSRPAAAVGPRAHQLGLLLRVVCACERWRQLGAAARALCLLPRAAGGRLLRLAMRARVHAARTGALLAVLLSPPAAPPGPVRLAPALEPPSRAFRGTPRPLRLRASLASWDGSGLDAGVAAGEDGRLEIAKLGISGRIVASAARVALPLRYWRWETKLTSGVHLAVRGYAGSSGRRGREQRDRGSFVFS